MVRPAATSTHQKQNMGISFSLIEKAVDLATRVFVTVRNTNNTTAEQSQLASVIDEVSKRIDSLANGFAGELSYQLEKQQLEKLSAQAKVVKFALEFGNDAMLATAVTSISEQVEYSRVRLGEGKHEWFGPWMIAESVRIEALRIMANSQRAFEVVQRETLNFRINILNHAGKLLIGAADSPWLKIADFVEGRNEDVLLTLREVPALQVSAPEPTEHKGKPAQAGSAPAAATALTPAAAWPFSTSLRP
jgi:hypothetical protein